MHDKRIILAIYSWHRLAEQASVVSAALAEQKVGFPHA
jgi:hypothetical protein